LFLQAEENARLRARVAALEMALQHLPSTADNEMLKRQAIEASHGGRPPSSLPQPSVAAPWSPTKKAASLALLPELSVRNLKNNNMILLYVSLF
jgi:hypothetical protein